MKHLMFCFALCFGSVGLADPTDTVMSASDGRIEPTSQPDATPKLQVEDSGQPAITANPNANLYLLLGAVGLLILIAIGAYLGAKGSLVIYHGWLDFILSVVLLGMVFIRDEFAQILTCILFIFSIGLSCWANRSLLKLILVLPTKFGLPILTLLSGVLALGSVSRLFETKGEVNRETAKTAVIGVACASCFLYLTKLIKQLVEPQESALLEAAQHNTEE